MRIVWLSTHHHFCLFLFVYLFTCTAFKSIKQWITLEWLKIKPNKQHIILVIYIVMSDKIKPIKLCCMISKETKKICWIQAEDIFTVYDRASTFNRMISFFSTLPNEIKTNVLLNVWVFICFFFSFYYKLWCALLTSY